MFYSSPLSLISHWILRTGFQFLHCYGGHSARRSERKVWRLGLRLTRVFVLRIQKAAFCEESFVFACLACKNVQRFRNRSVHEFYSLKASQMSKVRASSHEYPHVEKIKNFSKQNFKGEQATSNWIVTILHKVTSAVNIYLSLTLV